MNDDSLELVLHDIEQLLARADALQADEVAIYLDRARVAAGGSGEPLQCECAPETKDHSCALTVSAATK